MSTGHDPVDDLVLLLSNHSLPEQIDYDLNSTGSTMVSASVVDKISTCLLQSSPQLSRGLQNVLVLYASLLAPTHQPAVGITRASRVDTIESGERYAISTREAQEAALAEMISGELGESHYIMVHLIHPLNLHLRRILLGTGLNVYWRFVGHGPAGKPDIELVYDPSAAKGAAMSDQAGGVRNQVGAGVAKSTGGRHHLRRHKPPVEDGRERCRRARSRACPKGITGQEV